MADKKKRDGKASGSSTPDGFSPPAKRQCVLDMLSMNMKVTHSLVPSSATNMQPSGRSAGHQRRPREIQNKKCL